MHLIELDNVSKDYDGGLVKALREVTLQIPEGAVHAIMGPSGCGKTSLLNIIGSLDTPTSGTAYFDGERIPNGSGSSVYRNRQVGFVFQFHNLLPTLTLRENVELPLNARRDISSKMRRRRAEELLEEFGLVHRAHHKANHVSGGERQRAAVARAMVTRPRLILADEPTGNVDSETADMVVDVLLSKARENGMTCLIATHNREVACRSDRVVRLKDGRLVGVGITEPSD